MKETDQYNKKYPVIINKDNWNNFKHFEEFDGNRTYKEDYNKALEFQKKYGGELYTQINDDDYNTCYIKGYHYINRLGYTIIIKEGLKEKWDITQ